ncbi:MAG TPA: sigma-70 family RNA polymerase sigma factor [Chitinophagaceae bacterium]|nr:sigma-70 family RNA polymerase sigma factor [Chitinophagaceae bacterium]
MTDVGIIALMSDEHKNNITQTIKQHGRRLFNFIQSKVANTEDAKDILQDVFYQLAGNTKPVEQLSSWLFTVARNKITDNYRKKKPELLEDIFSGDEEDEFSWQEILFSSDHNPETEYLRNLFWTTLQNALDELPAEQKNAFVQNELNDISFDEMSKQTGIGLPTLISRKRYAVLHLRERLETLKNELLNY